MEATLSRSHRLLMLALIVLAYLVIGALYAALTPEWQVPDEPAHYNYIRQLAGGTWPVIELGDYDQTYLESLKNEGFPADRPTDAIQYEDHQPPLYYLLATPVYWLVGGDPVGTAGLLGALDLGRLRGLRLLGRHGHLLLEILVAGDIARLFRPLPLLLKGPDHPLLDQLPAG